MNVVANIVLLMVLLAPGTVFGEGLDGFSWERMDDASRYLLMAGYIHGFRHGTVYGADFGINTTSRLLKDLSGSQVYGVRIFKDYANCGTSIDKNRETILNAAAKYARNSLNKPVEFYVEEVDSFYRQFPSCRERELMAMLTDISLIWIRMRSFEDVGAECSKKESSPERERNGSNPSRNR